MLLVISTVFETEGLFKVTGSHVHRKCCINSKMVQNRVVATDH